ncbi:hypothetical protein VPH35_077865 [Triticum aestivum]|uniref:uncharacterized protein n=1 Tax=Triticum aestivum TaxID=4565 RepID=UPI0001BA8D3D|nr:uncharacterized protein LOC120962866 [Aegilops tauschii subsp. strangulata]XP_044374931.1 uncharacterized protein LOC123097294 [Triticum aestivum]XP_044374932.1 uncharacterized protein LOC123097294 [Triticum aestivum]
MDGSSATSPLGQSTVPIIANCVPTLSAVESVNSAQNQDFSDATSFAEINSPMLLINESSTPKKKQSFSQEGSLYKPQCDEELKPKVGMIFDDIGSVLEFYRTYAHNVGFGVRLGQQRVVNNVLKWKSSFQ